MYAQNPLGPTANLNTVVERQIFGRAWNYAPISQSEPSLFTVTTSLKCILSVSSNVLGVDYTKIWLMTEICVLLGCYAALIGS